MTRMLAAPAAVILILSCTAGVLHCEEGGSDEPVFHMQLWDAHKTGWRDAELREVAAAGFTVVQNGWNGSLFPSRGLLDTVTRHGLLYGAYIDTRYLFRQRSSSQERLSITPSVNHRGEPIGQLQPLDPTYQALVEREVTRGIASLGETPGLFKIMVNSEYHTQISYDELTRAAAVKAGVMKEGQAIPRYIRGVWAGPREGERLQEADPVRFMRWFDSEASEVVINRIAADTARAARPGLMVSTDPLSDGYTYGQYRHMDILQHWVRVHGAPRDPLAMASGMERLKAHLRHNHHGEIWAGPQLGTKLSDGRTYAAPADLFEESLWLAVAFGARGITCWGYDTLRPDSALDRDTWSRLRSFRDRLLVNYPWLLEAVDAPRRFAVLLSKANLVLSGRVYHEVDANYAYFQQLLLTAHIPTDVLYDEDIMRGALSRYEVLFLPGIEHLTGELEGAIADYEKAGGRVIRAPFIRLLYRDYEITKGNFDETIDPADPGRANLLPHQYRAFRHIHAARLSEEVSDLIEVTCDNPDVILNIVEAGGRRRILLVNDSRTYGPWTAERGHRWSEDKGLAASGTVTVGRGESARSFDFELPPAGITAIEID